MKLFNIDKDAAFYVAGHRGMAGSAVWRLLESKGFTNLIGRTSAELNLADREAVFDFMEEVRPRYVVLAAAKVGGILANSRYPFEFLSENLQIQVNVMDAALQYEVERLAFLGSSCIYPKASQQPIRESYLLTGPLEETNDAYAIAKIAGLRHVRAARDQFQAKWISVMPTNLYGPGDNYRDGDSHVLAALTKRVVDAKLSFQNSITNWGSGAPLREFLHVDDLADAVLFLLESYDSSVPINVGSGDELSIRDLSDLVCEVVGFEGEVLWDTTKPDGVYRKRLDTSLLDSMGFKSKRTLAKDLSQVIDGYIASLR